MRVMKAWIPLTVIGYLLAGGAPGRVASAPSAAPGTSSWRVASGENRTAQTKGEKPGRVKTTSGKLRKVEGNLLTIQKRGLVADSSIEIEVSDTTKKTGQVVPGMHVKVKYREVRDKETKELLRRVALEIEARPEFASKEAKKAAKQTQPP